MLRDHSDVEGLPPLNTPKDAVGFGIKLAVISLALTDFASNSLARMLRLAVNAFCTASSNVSTISGGFDPSGTGGLIRRSGVIAVFDSGITCGLRPGGSADSVAGDSSTGAVVSGVVLSGVVGSAAHSGNAA